MKDIQRRQALDARNAQSDKDGLSDSICTQVFTQPEYQQANVAMWYVHCRSEVRTLDAIAAQLCTDKTIVVPFCTKNEIGENMLGLWRLQALNELLTGCWGILEPPPQRWFESERQISADQLDVIVVPGVAFDRRGGRLGNGAGYYDRLLQQVRPDTCLLGVCYESQRVDQVIMEKHDVAMHKVITQHAIYTSEEN